LQEASSSHLVAAQDIGTVMVEAGSQYRQEALKPFMECALNVWKDTDPGVELVTASQMQKSTIKASKGKYCKEGGEELNGQLWSMLPEELVDRVLAFLPIHSLFRARTVCKRWSSIVFIPEFVDLRAKLSEVGCTEDSYYLMFPSYGENLDCSAYYPSSGHWQSLPSLSFLPAQVKTIRQGAGGLLLVLDNRTWVFHVCNPFTKSWREIPRLTHIGKECQTASAMVAAKDSKSYKIIAAGIAHTQVYDSMTNKWTVSSGFPGHLEILMFRRAVCRGILYIVALQAQELNRIGLVAYDVQTSHWMEIEDKLPPRFVNGHVVECGDYVAMVANVCTEERGHTTTTSLHVFKLHPVTKLWIEISRLPDQMFSEFMEERRLCGYSCVGVDGNVYITCSTGVRVLVFDTTICQWHWIENCPFPLNRGDTDGVHAGYSFKPSLNACA